MAKRASAKARTKIKTPMDLEHAVEKISVQMKGNTIGSVQLFGAQLRQSFKDSFTDGPKWEDTFVDGGQFLSNFNNLIPRILVQHPAIQFALERFQKAAKSTK